MSKTRTIVTFTLLWVMLSPVAAQTIRGVTIDCVYINKLTAVEREYWIWRLGLTPEEVAKISKACAAVRWAK